MGIEYSGLYYRRNDRRIIKTDTRNVVDFTIFTYACYSKRQNKSFDDSSDGDGGFGEICVAQQL